MQPVYTVKEVAALLKASESNVYALMDTGELPYVSIGVKKGRRIRPEDLEAFLEARRTQGAAEVSVPKLKHLKLA